jgi:hypothetical protein
MREVAESARLRLKRERTEQQNERELMWCVTGRGMSGEVDGLDVIGESQQAAGAGRNRWGERGASWGGGAGPGARESLFRGGVPWLMLPLKSKTKNKRI